MRPRPLPALMEALAALRWKAAGKPMRLGLSAAATTARQLFKGASSG